MRRRDLLALLTGVATLPSPRAVRQQRPRLARIGYLSANPRDWAVNRAFIQELKLFGYAEGRNLELTAFDYGLNPGGLGGRRRNWPSSSST